MKIYLPFLISIFIFSSCGQMSKKIAKDSLKGKYKGEATYIYKYSTLNLGIQDKKKSEQCYAMVFVEGKSPSLVVTSLPDLVAINIDISGFKLLTNGASFNIFEQVIKDKQTPINIQGNPIIEDTDGNKNDGFIDDKENLTFSYNGILSLNENGINYNLPFEAFYSLKKISGELK